MATLILSTVGSALFGPVGGFVGAMAGSALDATIQTSLTPTRVQPSRLSNLKVQGGGEGAAIPIVYGAGRITGQIIWAAQFKESTSKRTVGGKGGQRVVERSYSLSFAIGLCEGPIGGIGRVWVNGEKFDLSTVTYRLYLGDETQMPDMIIEAIEGINFAPAFRGLAYIVFEDLALAGFNDRIPQFSFEVFAQSPSSSKGPRLADLARAVCLIPGAGEFAYATTPITTRWGGGEAKGENLHVKSAQTDLVVSLDQLGRDLPNVRAISLVIAWFGTDLRAGMCKIQPRVDQAYKVTQPRAWQVAGLSRQKAELVTQVDDRPAYGGSPEDQSVIEAIQELKGRGHFVTHNPFVMMDIPATNTLPNPYATNTSGIGQAPYPWRGRITCYPGPHQQGSADGTASAANQVAAFFGTATAAQFQLRGREVIYSGPAEWSYRRFILHQAALAKAAGGVDGFLIGSELIGLTRLRSSDGSFPAVTALRALAAEVRLILGPNVQLGYGADWTEYGAYSPPGTSDLRFPLDPLWADPEINFIGIDWYPPLTDRRAGDPKPDLNLYKAGIEAGEAYDFYYVNDQARLAKQRTPITDGAYQEPWVWRQKDLRGFWSNAHYERNGGVRVSKPTPWVPKSKPIYLMEVGFPAVDKGANRPSVFPDPKSSEAGLPPFSNGQRDDGEQRLALEATLSYWRDNNPISPLYGKPMLNLDHIYLWTWDARPFPHFPQLQSVWGDGAYAAKGHWLAGRAGALPIRDILADIGVRAGLSRLDTSSVEGYIEGYLIENPSDARTLFEQLAKPFGLEAQPAFDSLRLKTIPPSVGLIDLSPKDFVLNQTKPALSRALLLHEQPRSARATTYASERDYQPATYQAGSTSNQANQLNVTLPVVIDATSRKAVSEYLAQSAPMEVLSGSLSGRMAALLEVGDRFSWEDGTIWRVDRLEGAWGQELTASRAPSAQLASISSYFVDPTPQLPVIVSPPNIVMLDLPAPFVSTQSPQPHFGAYAKPWPNEIEIVLGDKQIARLNRPMLAGELNSTLDPAPISRRLGMGCQVVFSNDQTPPTSGKGAFIADNQILDIVTWQAVNLVGPQTWRLNGLVRGYLGVAQAPAIASGTSFIVLNEAIGIGSLDQNLWGSTLSYAGQPVGEAQLATILNARFRASAQKPWSPCHAKAKRRSDGVMVSWIRRAWGDGDSWDVPIVPLGCASEKYRIRLMTSSGVMVHEAVTDTPSYLYPRAKELADFGTQQALLHVEICQLGTSDLVGYPLVDQLAL
ncbi:baseplate multidomain protein megatron [Candidatus Phycosocius spiralis]|uniref:Phage host specificity protein n=1 Tax=Candidatus Phycosocius spiralis TaxID=2815099 RepID=A0ABQ4PXB8_9PROT|nr:glycoside hydrolase TIM-barrel-like domain-containing protein [Candidatus Phycosocius spiralis]GIU67609.1 phage host specificity protein [Candidatus Phycosocius spiralis]